MAVGRSPIGAKSQGQRQRELTAPPQAQTPVPELGPAPPSISQGRQTREFLTQSLSETEQRRENKVEDSIKEESFASKEESRINIGKRHQRERPSQTNEDPKLVRVLNLLTQHIMGSG